MFIWFAKNKAHYEKGQIFPFAIAALAILLIMAMITANLGKLAIFKTDVSNAADAGALAGASILSGWLLGTGLMSDTWCGTAVVTTARMVEIAVLGRDDINIPSFSLTGGGGGAHTDTSTTTNADGSYTTTTTTYSGDAEGSSSTTTTNYNKDGSVKDSETTTDNLSQFSSTLEAMIMLFIRHLLKFYLEYPKVLLDSMMTWSNAKQTALRAAFGNSGVDEQPSLEWKNYSRQGMGSYDDYVNTYMSQDANQTGFSRFMSHSISGYGKPLGEIKPGTLSDIVVTSGYGWTQNADESFSGSYPGNVDNYADYENWVRVQVQGSAMYPVEALTFTEYFGESVRDTLTAIVTVGSFCKYCGWTGTSGDQTVIDLIPEYGLGYLVAAIFAIVTGVVFLGMIEYLPSGLKFQDDNDTLYTKENPIVVQVTRHKKNTNMGMWNFQYGDVTAVSGSHAFPEDSNVTIKPVLTESIKDLGNLLGSVTGSIEEMDWSTPTDLVTIMQGAFCMGLTFSVAGSILTTCNMASSESCAKNYINMAVGAFLTGNVPVALEFLAFYALCGDPTHSLNPQEGSATMNTSGLLGINTSDWFHTDYHLFETELYDGYIG